MRGNWILSAVALTLAVLCGCGGKNGLVGGGQGNPVFLTGITLTPANPSIAFTVAPQAPATSQFNVMGQYNVGSPKNITDQMTWLSLDTKVATVDSKGVATAVGSGRVIVVAQIFEPATQKTLKSTTILTVVPQLTGITVSPSSAQIAKGTAQQFTATGKYNDGTQVDITALVGWNSSQPAAASVSSSPGTQGRAQGLAAGAADIGATLGALNGSAALTVTNANLVSLAVTPDGPTVPLAASQQFTATGNFDDGSSQDISTTAKWTTSDMTIARVSSAGVVTGVGLGSAGITATAAALSDTSTTQVDASSVQRVSVVPVSKIANGTRVRMRASAVFQDGGSLEITHTPGIEWSSSSTAAATVAADSGWVSAVGPGSTTISAKLGGQSGSASLTVSDGEIQALSIAPNQALIAPGTTQNIVALATFADGSSHFQQDISSSAQWSSDNTGVATLSLANGLQELASGLTNGTSNLTAAFADTHGNRATSFAALNVSTATLNGISVTPGNAGLMSGGGRQLIATGNFSDGTTQDLTMTANWSTADDEVATVSALGFAMASGSGQTSIAAMLGSKAGSSAVVVNGGALVKIDICAATVIDPLNNCPPLDPETPPPPISFAKNVPYALIAIATYTDGSRADLTSSAHWTTSNPTAVGISNDPGIPGYVTGIPAVGLITGLAAGHFAVTATAGGASGSSDVIVTDATPTILTVTPMNGAVQLGLTEALTVTATFSDNTTQDVTPYVTWTTSNAEIAIVYPGGVVYPAGAGSAVLTASLAGVVGSTTMTVQ